MLQAVGRCDLGEGVPKEELQQFPYTVLQTIDNLWITASQGKFGFSPQKYLPPKWRETKRSGSFDICSS